MESGHYVRWRNTWLEAQPEPLAATTIEADLGALRWSWRTLDAIVRPPSEVSPKMLQRWHFREPSLSFGVPVFVCAAIIFPLHLGWSGASAIEFVGYLTIAAVLFSIADALTQSEFYNRWHAVFLQAFLSMCALALPAAIAFAIGSVAGPVDEAFDEEVCARRGAIEIDTIDAEVDDTFDITADCAGSMQ